MLAALAICIGASLGACAMLGQQRYTLAFGTAALHLFGSLLLTLAGIRTAVFFIAARA